MAATNMPVHGWKIIETTMFLEHKKLNVKYITNEKAWMTMTIFTEILRAVQASMGVQGRNVLLFLGNCDAHPQDTSFLRNVKVMYYPPSGSTILHTLDLGTRQYFSQLYKKYLVQKAVCLMD